MGKLGKIFLILFISISGLYALPFEVNLKYPAVTKTKKIKTERYDKLHVHEDKKYFYVYGKIWKQEFKYPKNIKDYKKKISDFVAKSLNIQLDKNDYAHFFKNDKEYWFKLSISNGNYNYTLLEVSTYPNMLKLSTSKTEYQYTKKAKKKEIPFAKVIPVIKGFGIYRSKYTKYDEQDFFYNKKPHTHKGKFWSLDFQMIDKKDRDSYRYINAHNYKEELLKHNGKLLEDEDNNFIFELNENNSTYIVKCSSYNRSFSLKIIQEDKFKQSLVLSPDKIKAELDKKGKITLDGIFFDFNKATLKKESTKAILSAVALMQKYTDLVLSVEGHTDSKGDDDYNLNLSLNRAKAVAEAMVKNGIDSKRLKFKGFGEQKPIVSNDTDEGRATNRRVELHKLSGGDQKAIIDIDFIKPLPNSKISHQNSYENHELYFIYTKPYVDKRKHETYKGDMKRISYEIIKNGKVDKTFSRKEILRNYENVLELYNGKIMGKKGNTLYFMIKDRGDKKEVYGKIEGYTGSYTIFFLVKD